MDRPQAIRKGYDMTDASEAKNPQEEYDIRCETAASRNMLERRIPDRLNTIRLEIVGIDKRHSYEPWRLPFVVDLVEAVERNAEQLLETMGKDRLPATAWIARNLLELLVWVRYCTSRENAWRFHGDALRDMKGLMDAHGKTCAASALSMTRRLPPSSDCSRSLPKNSASMRSMQSISPSPKPRRQIV